jgi:thiamine-phosphate pyrophosphorylase
MKLIVISLSKLEDRELSIINSMFEAGLTTFHIRKPRLSTKELSDFIEKIPVHFHPRLVIHTHHKLAGKYKVKGIHLTKSHLKKTRQTWWRLKLLSWKRPLNSLTFSSSHSKLSTLYEKSDYSFNYVFLSPVFDTLTGKFQSGFYEEGIKAVNAKSGQNVIARGGIEADKMEKVNKLGFNGVALYSTIWESDNPMEEFLKVIRKCNELGLEIE